MDYNTQEYYMRYYMNKLEQLLNI